MRPRTLPALAVIAVCVSVALAGCGGDEAASDTSYSPGVCQAAVSAWYDGIGDETLDQGVLASGAVSSCESPEAWGDAYEVASGTRTAEAEMLAAACLTAQLENTSGPACAGDNAASAATTDATADDLISAPDAAPRPQQLRGVGQKVATIRIARDTPVVVTATHTGASNFAVNILGSDGSDELVFNEIGSYRGTQVVTTLTAGRYRVRVDADGAWTLRVGQPNAPAGAPFIPTRLTGKGSQVRWVQTAGEQNPIITSTHNGTSNFVVRIIDAPGLGSELLVNEIGRFRGETTITIPAGAYMVAVDADGSWAVRFQP